MKYGFIINCEPDDFSFSEHIKSCFIYGIYEISKVYSNDELDKLKRVIIEKLQPYDKIKPSLCHMDVQMKNIIVNDDNITLIDWDDARSFPWVVDVARLLLMIELENDTNIDLYKTAFLNNYISSDLSVYKELELVLQVWHGLIILNFFTGGITRFNKIKNIIDEKIKLL
jgi:thiamine kinase-like enzyme